MKTFDFGELVHNDFEKRMTNSNIKHTAIIYWISALNTLEKTVAYFEEYNEYIDWYNFRIVSIKENAKAYIVYYNCNYEIMSDNFVDELDKYAE